MECQQIYVEENIIRNVDKWVLSDKMILWIIVNVPKVLPSNFE